MTSSDPDINEQLLAVTEKLGAQLGDGGNHRGIVMHAPFLLKMTSANPPGYLVKFRRILRAIPHSPPRGPQIEWHDGLPAEYAESGIRCDAEGDYVFLWIDEPRKLTPESIVNLITSYVKDHAQSFPLSDTYCFDCRQSDSASLVQIGNSVTTICQKCLERKKLKNIAENQRLNVSNVKLSGLLPLGLLLGSFGWAAFWTIYDAIFRITNSDRIWAPIVVIALVVSALGFGLGWPIGRILHRSGAVKWLPITWLSIFSAAIIVVFGEFIYASYLVFNVTGTFDFSMIIHATLPLALGVDVRYASYKFIFAVAVAVAIYEVGKPKTSKLRI